MTSAGPGMPADWRRSLDSAINTVNLQVNRDNVLEVMKLLLSESERLRTSVRRAKMRGAWVGECGDDPVSKDASVAFNQRIALLVEQCRQYAEQLGEAGRSMAEIAKRYGHSETEIAAAVRSIDRSLMP